MGMQLCLPVSQRILSGFSEGMYNKKKAEELHSFPCSDISLFHLFVYLLICLFSKWCHVAESTIRPTPPHTYSRDLCQSQPLV